MPGRTCRGQRPRLQATARPWPCRSTPTRKCRRNVQDHGTAEGQAGWWSLTHWARSRRRFMLGTGGVRIPPRGWCRAMPKRRLGPPHSKI